MNLIYLCVLISHTQYVDTMNYYVIIIPYLYVHDGKNKTIVQPYNIRESMIIVSSNIDKEQKYRQQAGMVDYLRSFDIYDKWESN